jgi:hypothetical protein
LNIDEKELMTYVAREEPVEMMEHLIEVLTPERIRGEWWRCIWKGCQVLRRGFPKSCYYENPSTGRFNTRSLLVQEKCLP